MRRLGLTRMRAQVAFIILVATACAVLADQSPPRRPLPNLGFGGPVRFPEQGGEAIYRHVCAGCHMRDGTGAAGAGSYPSLAADARLRDAAYPIALVLHGRKAMPPFDSHLTDAQIADVVNFVRGHFGNDFAPPATEAEVAAAR
jgi:cytochrome c